MSNSFETNWSAERSSFPLLGTVVPKHLVIVRGMHVAGSARDDHFPEAELEQLCSLDFCCLIRD
jgi:hypothetical protein